MDGLQQVALSLAVAAVEYIESRRKGEACLPDVSKVDKIETFDIHGKLRMHVNTAINGGSFDFDLRWQIFHDGFR